MEARHAMETVKDFAKELTKAIKQAHATHDDLIKRTDEQFKNEAVWRSEGRSVLNTLYGFLTNDLKNDERLTEAALVKYVQFLLKRAKQIKDTNQMYNVAPYSEINLACIELAKMLHNALPQSKTHIHYYDYLFPDTPCSRFKSSKGHLGHLELSEFFWGEKGEPVEIVATLEAFERTCFNPSPLEPRSNPPNTCIKIEEGMRAPAISMLEHTYLISNPMTDKLYKAIMKKDRHEVEQIKNDLRLLITRPGFDFGWRYKDSEKQLLKNGFITVSPGAGDLRALATILAQLIHTNDWKKVITAFDSELLYQICLPKQDGVTPIKRVIEEDQYFQDFMNCDEFYNYDDLRQVRAAKFIILELYIRVRPGQGVQTSVISQITGGRIVNSMDDKITTAEHLQGFYQREDLPLNRPDLHFSDIEAKATVSSGLSDGRLRMAVEHDQKIWNKVLALKNASSPSLLSVMNNNGGLMNLLNGPRPMPSVIYTENDLKVDAFKLSQLPVTEWQKYLADHLNEIGLRGLIAQNFIQFVNRPDLFLEDNENYNRAVLAILGNYYRRYRSKTDDITGAGRYLGVAGKYLSEDKQSKLELVDIFLGYIYSGKALNRSKFEEYLRLNNAIQHLPALDAKGYLGNESSSMLGTLVGLVAKVSANTFYHPVQSKGWKIWG